MRLIDADKLEEKIDDISRGYTSVYGVEEDDIYNAETVEAIPVPWIKARMEELESDGYMAEIGACGIKAILVQWEMEQKRN